MPSVDDLPPDQSAVLSLLLAQRRSYAEIAKALDLSEAAVSDRAYSALSALADPEKAPPGRRRGEIADYLLGQQNEDDAAKTKRSLMRSAADRAWARAAAAPLAQLASAPLPVIPGPEAASGAAGGATTAAPQAGASGSRGGIVLIIGALVVVALGAGFGLGRVTGGSDAAPTESTNSAVTNGSETKAVAVAQAALRPPAGAPAPKALGFAGISAQAEQRVLSVVAKSLPKAPSGSQYGVWLTTSGKPAVWLGYLQAVGSSGVGLQGTLNGDPKAYSGVLLTLEKATPTPTNPSTTYLVGALSFTGS